MRGVWFLLLSVAAFGQGPPGPDWNLIPNYEGATQLNVSGEVVYGDKHTFLFAHGDCSVVDQLFTVSSTVEADFSELTDRVIRMTINDRRAGAKVLGGFQVGYLNIVVFSLGTYNAAFMIEDLTESPKYTIKLIGSKWFDPAEYFDILEHSWDFTEINERFVEAMEACLAH